MHRFFPTFVSGKAAVGLLLVRLVMGAAFVLHGWGKIQGEAGPTAWMGDKIPPALQATAAFSEFVGGWAILVGVFTPLAALALIGTMIGALRHHILITGDPFVNPGGPSWELAAIYLAASVLILLVGPGVLSIDAILFSRRSPPKGPSPGPQ